MKYVGLSKSIVLLICTISCGSFAMPSPKEQKKEIVKMECTSVHWRTRFRNRQTPKDILSQTGRYSFDRVITYNIVDLQNLQQQVESLIPAAESDSAYIDTRTVCLLYTARKKIDTLSFGSYEYCQYNGKYYYLTWSLLQAIMQKLPYEQIEGITWAFEHDQNLKEQLIKNETAQQK